MAITKKPETLSQIATRQLEEMIDKRNDPVEQEREKLKRNRRERKERILKDAGL